MQVVANLSTGTVLSFSVVGFSEEKSPNTKLYDQIVPFHADTAGTGQHMLPDQDLINTCRRVWHRSYDALMFRRPVRYITDEDSRVFEVVVREGTPFVVYMNNVRAERVV